MSMLRKTPVTPVNDTEKALVLHSSAFRVTQPALPPPPTAAPSTGVELDLLDTLQRHWKLGALVFALIAGLGSAWAVSTMRPVYQAEATIYVPPDMGKDNPDGLPNANYQTLVSQQILTILHYDTLSDALQQLTKKGVPFRMRGETERQAVDRLRSMLEVQRVPDSYEIMVQMTTSDPRTAAVIANTVAQSFLDAGSRPDASGRLDRGSALMLEKAELEKDLKKQVDLRASLAESLQVVNLHKTTTLPDDEVLFQMRQALAAAQRSRMEAEEQLASGQSTVSADAEQLASNDPAARTLVSNLLQKKFELQEKIKSMLPNHPVRKEAEAQIAEIDAQLAQGPGGVPKMSAQLMAKLQAQAEKARRIEMDLTREIAQETSNIPGRTRSLEQAELVNGEIARIQDHLSRVEGQIEEISLRSTSGEAMRIFSLAQPPTAPAKNQKAKALGIIFTLALLMGLGLPVALDLTDARIYDPATIERILGFPIVGMTIERTPKTEQFADEHLRRLVSGIERGIAEGARSVLLIGIKQPVPASIMRDISQQLSDHKINVTVRAGRRRLESEFRSQNGPTRLIGPGVAVTDSLEDCDIVLMDAPALVFSAEAERLAAEADMTLVVVQAGTNTRPELVRGARLLERLNVPAVGVILQDVKVSRAGRLLRRDLKEYSAMQRQMGNMTRTWDGKAFV